MIKEFAAGLAAQMGLTLSRVSVINGKLLGCRDSHLLQLYSGGQMESALIYQSEIEALHNGFSCNRLETRIRTALARLKTASAP